MFSWCIFVTSIDLADSSGSTPPSCFFFFFFFVFFFLAPLFATAHMFKFKVGRVKFSKIWVKGLCYCYSSSFTLYKCYNFYIFRIHGQLIHLYLFLFLLEMSLKISHSRIPFAPKSRQNSCSLKMFWQPWRHILDYVERGRLIEVFAVWQDIAKLNNRSNWHHIYIQ